MLAASCRYDQTKNAVQSWHGHQHSLTQKNLAHTLPPWPGLHMMWEQACWTEQMGIASGQRQVTSLYNDCICHQENCPCIELSLLKK